MTDNSGYPQPDAPQGQPDYSQSLPAQAYPGYGTANQMPQQQYAQGYVAVPVNAKSKLVAGLLGIFVGWLGVHNFYLGFTGKAVAQLLISLLSFTLLAPISAIWGLIEGIMILTAAPGTPWAYDAAGNPLRN